MTGSSPLPTGRQARTIKIQCVTDTEHGHGHGIFYAILTSPHLYISFLVNPVRNSSGPLNPAGIILKHNHFAEQRGTRRASAGAAGYF